MAATLAQLSNGLQEKLSSFVPGNEVVRQNLLQSLRSLVAALESPAERLCRMCYSEPFTFAATRTLIDLSVFKTLAESRNPMTATQLGQATKSDPKLLERLLKHLTTVGFVQETGPDEYTANDITRTLASPGGAGLVLDTFQMMKIADSFPEYLKETNYANPSHKDKSMFKFAYNTDQHYFEYLNTPGREAKIEAFKQHMSFKTIGLKWFEKPDIIASVFGGDKPSSEDVLMVDVGGADGHDITAFHNAHPDIPGRLILEDLPSLIENLDSKALIEKGVTPTGHDFFNPQPIQHAKVYYLKMVLHDWPVEQCKQILTNIKPAMKKDYSRILLNEIVVPDVKAGWFETSVDMLMMTVHSAQERREKEWREMIESIDGLKVKKIWDVEGAVEKVIEIELE